MLAKLKLPLPISPVLSSSAEHWYDTWHECDHDMIYVCMPPSSFSSCVNELPPGQCVEIMELLCQLFQEKYLSKLRVYQDGAKRKRRRKSDAIEVDDIDFDSLAPVILRYVDLFAVVLSNLPLDMWSSRLAGRAHTLLQEVHSNICLPFLDLCPSLVSCSETLSPSPPYCLVSFLISQPPGIHSSFCSASLLLTCKCLELQLCLQTWSHGAVRHADWSMGMSWKLTSSGEVLLPASWSPVIEEEEELVPMYHYLMVCPPFLPPPRLFIASFSCTTDGGGNTAAEVWCIWRSHATQRGTL